MTLANNDPLAALIMTAARLPKTGTVEVHQKRIEAAGNVSVVLADVSSSMANEADGGRRRIDVLQDALRGVAYDRLLAFSQAVVEVTTTEQLPTPSGNTALHLAIKAASGHKPGRTLIVSDGEPDDEVKAIAEAEKLGGRIDVVFCGPESNIRARSFLMRLASLGGGRFVHCDISRQSNLLAPAIRGLLGPGARR
jgi:Mg-chelatase subunit ChlD